MDQKSIHITAKDYLVSGEEFQIVETNINGILKTIPAPNQERISYYYQSDSYISHTDANDNFIDKIYQTVKKHSIKNKYKTILNHKKNVHSLLDIGSGTGDFLSASINYNISSTGTEPNEQARKISQQKGNKVVAHIDDIKDQKFDVITLWHVLEHVHQPSENLKKINNLLKDDGLLIIAVPNYKSYDSMYYKENWAAYDVPRHLWHFSKIGMQTLMEKENLSTFKCKPLPFDSFYVSLLSEQNKTGTKNMIKAFTIGFLSNLKALFNKQYSSIIYLAHKNLK